MKAPLPLDEKERLKALESYQILDTESEQGFDDITFLASQICGTPIACVTLVDENRQWFKSKLGTVLSETPRDIAFCAHTILQKELFVVENAEDDSRFVSNPLVTGDTHVRFYAGAPLITSEGRALGTLCVIDKEPRTLSADQMDSLRALARQVIAQLEIRRRLTEMRRTEASLRLLNSAVLQSSESILITDAQIDSPGPAIIFVNPAFTHMTGYMSEEVLGKTPRILQGLRTDKSVLNRLRRSLETGEVFNGEAINYRKDGTEFTLEWQVAPLRDEEGRITNFIAIQRDITERRLADRRFRRLMNSNVQAVFFWGRTGKITEANDAFLRLVHSTRADLEAGDIDWAELTPPEYAHLDLRALEEIKATGVSAPYEKEFLLKDGLRVPVLLGAASFEDKPDEGVCFMLDLTDRKRLESSMLQSQKLETLVNWQGV